MDFKLDYKIIDAHSHLWLKQDTLVNGLPIYSMEEPFYY